MTKSDKTAGLSGTKYYLTVIRALSCIAVVILHTFHTAIAMNLLSENENPAAYAIRDICYFAVPCFIMVTGVLLLAPERTISMKKLFGKYILRIFAALVVFTILFALADSAFSGNITVAGSLRTVPKKIWADGSWSHMWYLYTLIGLYLLMPAFRKIAAYSDRKEILYLIAAGMVFLTFIPTINTITGTESGFRIAVTSIYPLFLFTGYAIDRGYLNPGKMLSCLTALLSAVGIVAMALFQDRDSSGILKELLAGYTFPLVFLMSAGLFSFIRTGRFRTDSLLSGWVKRVDRSSFGIYLLHLFWLRLIVTKLSQRNFSKWSIPVFLLIALAVFILSHISSAILRRVPLFRKVL